MGDDFWRYGIDANRPELEAAMRYTDEQGLVRERRKFEEMFHSSTLSPTAGQINARSATEF
jgi:4,5-dihydroxyphthalate decarboxylase